MVLKKKHSTLTQLAIEPELTLACCGVVMRFTSTILSHIELKKYVKYESEEERMLALKTKCLIKNADKFRIANETTLDDCWIKLDQEYGDIDTLVADIFTQWSNLKSPNNDAQVIKFMAFPV